MADSDISVAKTIVYLRPQATAADDVLDITANERYVIDLEPPPEPVDLPVEGIPDPLPATHLTYPSNQNGGGSRQGTPGLYSVSRRVLRLAFDSIEQPSARGFEFGNRPNSDVKVPYYQELELRSNSKASLPGLIRMRRGWSGGWKAHHEHGGSSILLFRTTPEWSQPEDPGSRWTTKDGRLLARTRSDLEYTMRVEDTLDSRLLDALVACWIAKQ